MRGEYREERERERGDNSVYLCSLPCAMTQRKRASTLCVQFDGLALCNHLLQQFCDNGGVLCTTNLFHKLLSSSCIEFHLVGINFLFYSWRLNDEGS